MPPSPMPLPQFLRKTWSGRILLVNLLIFAAAGMLSGSLFEADSRVLWRLGAQDPVSILQGQYFRFFTPIFLHGGLIHFLFNSMAIFVVGRDLEPVFGHWRFLLIFLFSGVFGAVASAALGVNQSVGASGAIFGMLGAGLVLEKSIARHIEEATGKKPGRGPYMGMLIINIPISFLPMIDSYAHLGGFVAGVAVTFALFKWFPNRLLTMNRPLSAVLFAALFLTMGAGIGLATNENYIHGRYLGKIKGTDRLDMKLYYMTAALEIEETPELLSERGLLLLGLGEYDYAETDLVKAVADRPGLRDSVLDGLRKALTGTGPTADGDLPQPSHPPDRARIGQIIGLIEAS